MILSGMKEDDAMRGYPKRKKRKDNGMGIDPHKSYQVAIICGDRRLIGRELFEIVDYRDELCKTPFGKQLLIRALRKYAVLDNEIFEDRLAMDFLTEENLENFKMDCRTYLGLPEESYKAE